VAAAPARRHERVVDRAAGELQFAMEKEMGESAVLSRSKERAM
jgi:hypothetical protein